MIKWKGTDENGADWDDTWEPGETVAKDAPNELGRFLAYRNCLSFSEQQNLPFAVRRKIDEIYSGDDF